MRTLVHLSDLHFGRTLPALVAGLQSTVASLEPDLVIVSGDFTQRAKISEFQEARAFLDTLPAPYLAVPGNHDIRLYDLYGRFIRPLEGYMRYISPNPEPQYVDPELNVVCVNTARSLTFKGGRINEEQVERVCRELDASPADAVRILVAHHPLDLPDHIEQPLAGRARQAMARLGKSGLDMILSGHLHVTYFPVASECLQVGGHTALVVQAGTAVSTRGRGQVNSFNRITTERDRIEVTQFCWSAPEGAFQPCSDAVYARDGERWIRQ